MKFGESLYLSETHPAEHNIEKYLVTSKARSAERSSSLNNGQI